MKCFYHEDREAVATCQHCGKFLCKACAQVHTPCLCQECFDLLRREEVSRQQTQAQERRQKFVDALVDTRAEFLRTCAIGVVTAVLLSYLCCGTSLGLAGQILFGGLCFFIPFGWKLLTYLQSFLPITIFGTIWFWLFWIMLKGIISIFVGIPAFAYQAIRTWQNQKRLHAIQHAADQEVI